MNRDDGLEAAVAFHEAHRWRWYLGALLMIVASYLPPKLYESINDRLEIFVWGTRLP